MNNTETTELSARAPFLLRHGWQGCVWYECSQSEWAANCESKLSVQQHSMARQAVCRQDTLNSLDEQYAIRACKHNEQQVV